MTKPVELSYADSMASQVMDLETPQLQKLLEELKKVEPEEALRLMYDWKFWARPNQLAPEPDQPCMSKACDCNGNWRTWLILAGRGWGKTRAGAEWVNEQVREKRYGRFHLVGATASDVRDIMVEGPSGVIPISHPDERPQYRPTKRAVEWPNGARALCFSAEEFERLRGEQCEAAWADELAAWRYDEAWTQLMLGLRLGMDPRVIVTTTPRPTSRIKKLMTSKSTHLTHGITWENVDNLAATFTDEITREYEGQLIGRQELYAEILSDAEGALWKRELLEKTRIEDASRVPAFKRIVIAIDPAVSMRAESSETGIIVCGQGVDDHAYVIEDLSGRYRVEDWARVAVKAYYRHEADRIIAEKNMGGDMVETTIRVVDESVPIKLVHASRGKYTRAEPIAAAYERGVVHHIGYYDKLEEQMCMWVPGDPSPDRLDALVWGMTEFVVAKKRPSVFNMVDDGTLWSERSDWKIA